MSGTIDIIEIFQKIKKLLTNYYRCGNIQETYCLENFDMFKNSRSFKTLKGIVMQDIVYNPLEVGKEFLNKKGKLIKIRKYHLTDEEAIRSKENWRKEIKSVDKEIKDKAGNSFFNPYRQGIYYYQVQTLFLLGANEWHSLSDIVDRLEIYTSQIKLRPSVVKSKGYHSAWDKFRGKTSRSWAVTSKDYIGRIQENFIMLQRLSTRHPYGYKLHQVHSALDIKRMSKTGFSQGVYFYRLSTYPTQAESLPIKDFSGFVFPLHQGKYVTNRFIGTIVTKDETIVSGKVINHG
jgi:hypothetical protein